MRDSPTGCATLGLNLHWTRVRLFALSAGIGGFAGGLFGGLRETVAATDFQLFNSLPLLLLAVALVVGPAGPPAASAGRAHQAAARAHGGQGELINPAHAEEEPAIRRRVAGTR
ncbi:MAG: branched-chain amino acid transport system permease protein livM [Micromonosporaceae bacterium]|nr:branched-chain amino acid transport system permease protein livM [Micromonosporaceae bacterium]